MNLQINLPYVEPLTVEKEKIAFDMLSITAVFDVWAFQAAKMSFQME